MAERRLLSCFLTLCLSLLLLCCGPSQKKACEGCSGDQLAECEETFELCKHVQGCKRHHVKQDYANGLCQAQKP